MSDNKHSKSTEHHDSKLSTIQSSVRRRYWPVRAIYSVTNAGRPALDVMHEAVAHRLSPMAQREA